LKNYFRVAKETLEKDITMLRYQNHWLYWW